MDPYQVIEQQNQIIQQQNQRIADLESGMHGMQAQMNDLSARFVALENRRQVPPPGTHHNITV